MTDRPMACDIELRVRYPEVDQMGVLHHSRFWVYFEMGRVELLRARGIAYADLEREGAFFVVAKCSARFLAPARYDEVLRLSTRIVRVGAARIDHAYELRRNSDSTLLCSAETTIACVDRTGRIIPIPQSVASRDETPRS